MIRINSKPFPISQVQSGFQKFGFPVLTPPVSRSHMTSILQGLQFGMRCLAQLTATQYAVSVCSQSVKKHLTTINHGRIVVFCSLESPNDLKDVEKAALNLLRMENTDIKQKQDPVRLPIQRCEVAVVNVYVSGAQSQIMPSPSRQISNDLSVSVYSYHAKELIVKTIDLVKTHFTLKSTSVTNIPMKEEQSGGGSFNYDVELIHKADAHRDIIRSGHQLDSSGKEGNSKETGGGSGSRRSDTVMLRWSTPKSMTLDLHYCSSVYRVTPADVTSRPTICLINFVLSGKPVLLEQPRKANNSKLITHLLTCHGGGIFLHCIPGGRSCLDEPPSISEGWGGRVTDYRISDFSSLIQDNMLVPNTVERTKIPSQYPLQLAEANLERMTRHWPLVFSDTVAYSMVHELEPLLSIIHRPVISDPELDSCKEVIKSIQDKEEYSEPLPIPSSGTRTRGSSKRDEQYHLLWNELEVIASKYRQQSEQHRMLYDFISHAVSQSPSCQNTRALLEKKEEEMAAKSGGGGGASANNKTAKEEPAIAKTQSVTSNNKVKGMRSSPYPVPAKPVASLLSIWTTQLNAKAMQGRPEFRGRATQSNKAELYTFMKNGSDR
ncbi:PREDICTED: protein asunder homolog isoform X2 [Amphimedon queenslandica]|uniref:Protein asunder n=1 Tax=Amphimedon queenslandica TaxID=400682 RepID=A0AAN0IKA2_AMPQE|nr:PREDICTED: protein asunder homolog isoform X2 [Amphimedon queenslandica]|eukprot:XP_011402687.2 PREDICTED: protein asunder homolog isoform X2 [Amphimedon queenslandica]